MRPKRERCVHFNGIGETQCRARVVYASTREPERAPLAQYPCFGDFEGCAMYECPTEEAIAEHEATVNKVLDAMKRGVSPCCDAPEDKSQVITEGTHKGHGPRFCSKCGKLIYMV